MNIVPKMSKLDKGANITKRNKVRGSNEQIGERGQNYQIEQKVPK